MFKCKRTLTTQGKGLYIGTRCNSDTSLTYINFLCRNLTWKNGHDVQRRTSQVLTSCGVYTRSIDDRIIRLRDRRSRMKGGATIPFRIGESVPSPTCDLVAVVSRTAVASRTVMSSISNHSITDLCTHDLASKRPTHDRTVSSRQMPPIRLWLTL